VLGGAWVLEREMGCSRHEFLRWLPGAADHARAALEPGGLTLAVAGGHLRIDLQERPPRRIARLSLPVLAVRFTFDGVAPADREAFLARFDAYTRRGGG
jgi:hypothetical protein